MCENILLILTLIFVDENIMFYVTFFYSGSFRLNHKYGTFNHLSLQYCVIIEKHDSVSRQVTHSKTARIYRSNNFLGNYFLDD